jgi:hypothetical protein
MRASGRLHDLRGGEQVGGDVARWRMNARAAETTAVISPRISRQEAYIPS